MNLHAAARISANAHHAYAHPVPVHPRAGSAANAMRTHAAAQTYVFVFRAFAHLAHVRLHV